MNKFINNEGKEVGQLTVISTYFRKPEESISDFKKQCDQLTPEDKEELALGAAKELGWTVAPQ